MAESKIRDDNYFQISGWMINRLGLRGIALEVYAIIYGFSQDGESYFTGSLQYLSDFTNSSRPTVIKALKQLVESGLIIKEENEMNGVKFCKYKVSLQVVKNLYRGSKETLQGGSKESLPGGGKETLPNNKLSDNKLSDNKEDKEVIISSVVDYLNEKVGTNFKATTESTRKLIIDRLKDGFTLEDFKCVIDKKCAAWKGDKKMSQYLRPSTLFGNKFEGYLNEIVVVEKPKGRNEPVPNWMNNRPGETELERLKRITADITGVPETAGNNPELAARAEALKQQLAR